MAETKAIDVRGLEHTERENLIFPNVERLEQGEKLRIHMEFNPLPLVYMLNAREEFGISYEKEGPEEWILLVERTSSGDNRKEHFKTLLREFKDGEISEETKEKAKKLLQSVDAKTLGIIEQELIKEGVSHEEIRHSLCDIHLEILRDSLVAKKIEVEAPHPAHTFMEEHVVILEALDNLTSLVDRLKSKDSFDEMGEDLAELKDISHHLVEAESHHQREEDVLFPKLAKHDIVEPTEIMKLDHVEFRKRKQELFKMAHNHEDYDFGEFKKSAIELGEYLSRELEGHIFKEDNIIYQIALQVLTEDEWDEVKKEADKIGYCCFTPDDQSE